MKENKPREWRITHQTGIFCDGSESSVFGPDTGAKSVKVVEFSAYQKAIDLLNEADKLILDDNVFGAGVEITQFLQWKRKMHSILTELGFSDTEKLKEEL